MSRLGKVGQAVKQIKIMQAVEQVREAKDIAGTKLSQSEYWRFLEELLAEAEGWRMELDER